MSDFEKYISTVENQELKEYLKYCSEREFNMIEFHFNNYHKSRVEAEIEKINNAYDKVLKTWFDYQDEKFIKSKVEQLLKQ